MFTHHHAAPAAVLPRPAYPEAGRIVVDADRRTRQLAEAMLRLNAEDPDGCTEVTLDREGFSAHEQQTLGPTARRLANLGFVKRVDEGLPEFTDEDLIAIALDKVAGLIDLGLIVSTLRADRRFSLRTIDRLWPELRKGIAASIATAPIPGAA